MWVTHIESLEKNYWSWIWSFLYYDPIWQRYDLICFKATGTTENKGNLKIQATVESMTP